jgi:hypothetical protein
MTNYSLVLALLFFLKPSSPNKPSNPSHPQLLWFPPDAWSFELGLFAATADFTPESPAATLLLSAKVPVPVPETVAAPGAP